MTANNRIAVLDLLKGLVIIFMALDHSRDYFHFDSFIIDPGDPVKSNLPLFFTRWITHYCAPAFSFLAGVSAFLVGKRKSRKALSAFLLKRGFWLIFIEFTVIRLAWTFNFDYSSVGMGVIWSLGISMVLLAALVHLSLRNILILSLIILFGHHLLDRLPHDENLFWYILHERNHAILFEGLKLRVIYPIIPWIGVMSLGYYFGKFYDRPVGQSYRRQLFVKIGWSCIGGFLLLRGLNCYGNSAPWTAYGQFTQSLISFMNPAKYPPSLSYLLMTLGPVLLFLAYAEKLKGPLVRFFSTYGKVPFFFYILHIYLIHGLAALLAEWTGFGFEAMILKGFVSTNEQLQGFGVNLAWTYGAWLLVLALLYPLCRKFGQYKMKHKDQWWLSYF